MKKLLIATLVLIAAYAVGAAVLAVANGQAEGAVLNAEKQLLADGDMEESGIGSWSQYHAAASKVAGAVHDGVQVLHVAYAGDIGGSAYQGGFTAGKKYHMTGWARGDGTSVPTVITNASTLWTGTDSSSWQRIDIVYVHTGNANIQLGSADFESGSYVEFDDVFVTEYTGDITSAQQQLLTDGDMEASDTTAWTVVSGAVLSKEADDNHDGNRILRITYGGTIYPIAQQNSVITAGTTYRVTGWARGDGGSGDPRIYGTSVLVWDGSTDNTWQRIDTTFTADNAFFRLRNMATVASYVEFDDIMLTEYTGYTTDASKQIFADGDMEKADTSDWAATSNAILTKESGGYGDGERILRVAYGGTTNPLARQNVMTAGTRYRITGWARQSASGGTPRVTTGNAGTTVWQGTTDTDWQKVDATFTAGAGITWIGLYSAGTSGSTEWDDMLITEL